jgi:hypothetical protein
VRPTTGQLTFDEAKQIFPGGLDSNVVNWKVNRGQPTKKALANVYELVKDGTFQQFLQTDNLDKLVWEWEQVVVFCQDHRDWLRTEGYAILFPPKGNVVAYVLFDNAGPLLARVRRLSDGVVWDAGSRYRVVLPQLMDL